MRCLANALLLQPQCRQILVDKGHAEKVAEKLKVCMTSTKKLVGATESAQSDNADDEFLTSRILFLLTYDTNLDFDPLVREKGLGDAITQVRRGIIGACRPSLTLGAEHLPALQAVLEKWQEAELVANG